LLPIVSSLLNDEEEEEEGPHCTVLLLVLACCCSFLSLRDGDQPVELQPIDTTDRPTDTMECQRGILCVRTAAPFLK
jgi:hypothetical protein